MRTPLAALAALFALCGLAAHAQDPGPVNYGDDTSDYANNGECDDPRFEGEGMAAILIASDLMRDAADCSAGVEAGRLSYIPLPAWQGEGAPPAIDAIEFGDDEGDYANNGKCDDPRFGGRMMATVLIASDIRHDASDCRKWTEAREIVFLGDAAAAAQTGGFGLDEFEDDASDASLSSAGGRVDLSGIDFGDNESAFALNGECDDRRFAGQAMASLLIEADIGHDASDCALAVIEGRAHYRRAISAGSGSMDAIDFGDDSSNYSHNLECDDPRFIGEGMASLLIEADIGHDAADCLAAMEAGTIEFVGEAD